VHENRAGLDEHGPQQCRAVHTHEHPVDLDVDRLRSLDRLGSARDLNGAGAAGYRWVAAQAVGREKVNNQLAAPPTVACAIDR
jgi:hypothetical protein